MTKRKSSHLVDGGAGSSLTEAVLSVTRRLGLAYTRLPVAVFIERIGHRDADTETPQEVPVALLVPVSTRLHRQHNYLYSTCLSA